MTLTKHDIKVAVKHEVLACAENVVDRYLDGYFRLNAPQEAVQVEIRRQLNRVRRVLGFPEEEPMQ